MRTCVTLIALTMSLVNSFVCPELLRLDLSGCNAVTDCGLQHIAAGCPKIEVLSLEGLWRLSDTGLLSVVFSCRDLVYLFLSDCDVTDSTLHAIAEKCPRIKRLILRGLDRVTDDGLECIGRACSGLSHLDLGSCGGIGDAGVRSIVSGCPRMRRLILMKTRISNMA